VAEPFRILLVEDEPIIRELVRTMLDEQGAVEVTCIGDGAQAVKKARELRPSLVLLDIVLPGMDGITACRFLRAEPFMEDVPIYMLTARVKASDHEASRRAGATGHIEKPFKGTELMALVQQLRKGEPPSLGR
jgi:CheY-like chemotaxis protein